MSFIGSTPQSAVDSKTQNKSLSGFLYVKAVISNSKISVLGFITWVLQGGGRAAPRSGLDQSNFGILRSEIFG
jgi:hypothetical protein